MILASSLIALVVYLVLAVARVLRLIRFYQLEEYKANRFLKWIVRTHDEITFVILNGVAVFLILALVIAGLSIAAPIGLALGVLTLIVRPKDVEIKQKFNPTPRAKRLRTTTLIVIALPSVIALLISVTSTSKGNVLDAEPLAIAGMIGASISAFLATVALPIANLINFPIEEFSRQYYLRLARENLGRSGATVIALTGSYGKTSTKFYLHHILDGYKRVIMTPKSYNTLLGICRVINDILAGNTLYDYFIVEAGAYIPGEIKRICELVKPQISIVTTVGPMHLERFGSIDNIVKAKYEIIEALPSDGVGVFNADNAYVRGMADRGYPSQRLLTTQHDAVGARISASNVEMFAEGTRFTVHDQATGNSMAMTTPIFGEFNVSNILLAIAVARHLGMSLEAIAGRVATLEPAEHRLVRRVLQNGVIVIDDAYSANPQGTQMALSVLSLQRSAHRIVLSSGMFELGELHEQENRKLGERIAAVATHVVLIGTEQTKPVQQGLTNAGFPPEHIFIVKTLNEAMAAYQPIVQPGDSLLILTDLPDTYAK